jgi:pimeloyl-ACP methyl ester carboxylesterase
VKHKERGAAEVTQFLLVHGAGSGPWIWEAWEGEPVDLQAGLNVGAVSMLNYEAAVARAAEWLEPPLVLVGWSMGGLVAMMAARRVEPERLVLLEPSPPAEVQGFAPDLPLEEGVYDPEGEYGPFPEGVRARPESLLARSERRRGISVPALPCPTLVVYGDEYADERGRAVAAFYGTDELKLEGASHWDLVLGKKVAAAAVGWA